MQKFLEQFNTLHSGETLSKTAASVDSHLKTALDEILLFVKGGKHNSKGLVARFLFSVKRLDENAKKRVSKENYAS